MAPEKKNLPVSPDDLAEQQLEEGLTLILSALPRLLIRWLKTKL